MTVEKMKQNTDNPLVKQSATTNPYRLATNLILKRLRWDLHPESWLSRKKLKKMRDQNKGSKAVILCNGPSLLKTDFSSLEKAGVVTFGLNKINLLFDKEQFRPGYIVAMNPLVIEQNTEFYQQTDIPLFIDSYGFGLIGKRKNIAYLHSTKERKFSRDVSMSIYQGYTVTYVALQLAFHLGFDSVALVGCDHNFNAEGASNQTVNSGATDENHFDPNYFAGGMKWHLPDLFESEVSYTMARKMYEAFGRKIIDSTVNGKLEVFDKMPLDEFLSG